MSSQQEKISEFDSTSLIMFIYNWRKLLISISLIAAVASAIFSGPSFIKPKYESKVVLFPGSTSSISKAVLNESASIKNDVLQFGDEEESEQMLQILNSDEIRYKIIDKYNLMAHYEIDADEEFPKTKLNKLIDDNITFRRTEFMSVEISVLDTDADTAALIANDIAAMIDSVKNRMQKSIAVKAFAIVEKQFDELNERILTIKDSLNVLGSLGIHDYESQSEVLNLEYAKAIAKNDQRAVEALGKKLDILSKYGSTQLMLKYNLENIYGQVYPNMKRKYDEARVDATENLPHKFIVNKAYAAEKKSYPIRWLIVVVSTLGAFLICVVSIIVMDNIKRIRQAV